MSKKYKLKYPSTYLGDLELREARHLMNNVINASNPEDTPAQRAIPARWIIIVIAIAIIAGGIYGIR